MTAPAAIADVLAGRARWAVECGDALAVLPTLPDACVDLIATDPPFFKLKDDDWDHAWPDESAYLAWLGTVRDEWRRVLRPNGGLYCFASSRMAARVEIVIAERFDVLNSIVWEKPRSAHNRSDPQSLRSFFPATERIIFAEVHGADGSALRGSGYAAADAKAHAGVFEPLRAYLDGERIRAGITARQVDEFCGTNGMAGHWFGASQWELPTAAAYAKLRELFNSGTDGGFLRREYEDLRREYEDLRRPFVLAGDPVWASTDVWHFTTVPFSEGKHPCEKPADLCDHLIHTSTRPDALVLDCFAGSGAILAAAVRAGRRAIGCDADPAWTERVRALLAATETGRVVRPFRGASADPGQLRLFGAEEAR